MDPRAIQQINFTANLDRDDGVAIVFITEQSKTVFEFSQGTVKVLWIQSYKMTQYNSLNVKLLNSQLNKLKSAIKNESEVVLRVPYELLLTDRQVSSLRKSFANNSSADIKLSKTQLSKMIQSGGFLSRLLGPLLKQDYH